MRSDTANLLVSLDNELNSELSQTGQRRDTKTDRRKGTAGSAADPPPPSGGPGPSAFAHPHTKNSGKKSAKKTTPLLGFPVDEDTPRRYYSNARRPTKLALSAAELLDQQMAQDGFIPDTEATQPWTPSVSSPSSSSRSSQSHPSSGQASSQQPTPPTPTAYPYHKPK